MRVAFLVQLPKKVSPGQRFRIEQYESVLLSVGIKPDTYSFIGSNTYKILYKRGHIIQKFSGVLGGFIKRFLFLFKAHRYNYIFLQREAAPVGPPIFEWILIKLLHKKVVLDFDDAIWIKDPSGNNEFANIVKCFWKVKYLCKWSSRISVGNHYLTNYAKRYNEKVVTIPTSVDTKRRYNKIKNQNTEKTVIGWTGSHSTLKYLNMVLPVLKKMESELEFEFVVICDRPPDFQLKSLRFIKWDERTEIEDLLKINIGIMPLIEDAWANGKCGFKLIQYLALGIPAIASPVGVNKEIIDDRFSGYLCETDQDWTESLLLLLKDVELRTKMGWVGRMKIESQYSLQANEGLFLSLFE